MHASPSPEHKKKKAGLQNGVIGNNSDDELEKGVLDIKSLLDEDNFREDEW